MEMEAAEEWGTWEELILVSAVLRHGTRDWDAVVAELRARTFAPGRFSEEVCREKYEDLQRHYSTCSDLLEGLRRQRIVELKRTLEKSNGSIGFLQTKLQTLKAGKEHSSSVDYQSSPFESPAQTSAGQSSGKETSKDGLSAGSFTQEIIKIQSPPIHAKVVQALRRSSASSKRDSLQINEDLVTSIPTEWGVGGKKKRGKRKRRGRSEDAKEDNSDEVVLDSANPNQHLLSLIKVEPTSECDLARPPYVENKFSQGADGCKSSELTRIFDMIASNDYAYIFRRRLDSQKRARYRMMVRRHMDLEAIKCRIDKQTITSTKELLRDLLLLATNAAIYYSRNTREHKYAVILHGVIKKIVTEYKNCSIPSQAPAVVTASPPSTNEPRRSPANTIPKKPKTANADNQKSMEKMKNDETISKALQGAKKTSKPKDSHPTKTSGQAGKVNGQARKASDVSRQQPQTKLASVNALNTKDGYMHQPQVKLASVNASKTKDGPWHQPPIKSDFENGSKEKKRARKL